MVSSPTNIRQLHCRSRIPSMLQLVLFAQPRSNVTSKISGDAGHLFGDGLAIWLTTARAQPGPVFGSTGALPLNIILETLCI